MTLSYIWRDSFICLTWHIHKRPAPLERCFLLYMSCHTYAWVMSHTWMSHVTHMHEPCLAHNWVMSHICMSHVSHMSESSHIYAWVMSHIRMSHVIWSQNILLRNAFPKPKAHITASRRTCQCLMYVIRHSNTCVDFHMFFWSCA